MIAVGVRKQDRAQTFPIEAERGHFRLERFRVTFDARIDQDEPFRGLYHVRGRGVQTTQKVNSRHDRDRGGGQKRDFRGGTRRDSRDTMPEISKHKHRRDEEDNQSHCEPYCAIALCESQEIVRQSFSPDLRSRGW